MLFNSYIFIFAFLPLCLIGYYALRGRNANLAKCELIAFSLWFYGYFNTYYLLIMVGSVLVNYAIYKALQRSNTGKLLATGVVVNLAVLFYFKYFDFFLENVNMIFKSDIPLRGILLPLGISFFTFQQISFLHDVYRGDIKKVTFVDYALFVTFFPQLIAGPIVTGDEMLPQFRGIADRKFDTDSFANGLYLFVMGLAKKVIIADTLAKAVNYGYDNLLSISATEAVLVILYYTLQLYFDFSGYCDMAIGIGRMLGFEIAVNFNSPYKAASITEFWKRWHITLSRFFTKNIYIPLGGNRKGKVRMYVNLFIVFFLSGLWHGAGWNFVLWGCMHGILYVITRAYEIARKDKLANDKNKNEYNIKNTVKKVVCVLLTFIFINIAWVFFRADSVNTAVAMLRTALTGEWRLPGEVFADFFNLGEFWYVLKVLHLTGAAWSKYILMIVETCIIMLITFFTPNVHEICRKQKFNVINGIITGVLLVWCIVSLSGVSTFLYFNF